MTSKNWRFAAGENPFTSLVTWRMICGSGTGSFFVSPSRIIVRARFSISGTRCSILSRSPASVT